MLPENGCVVVQVNDAALQAAVAVPAQMPAALQTSLLVQ